MVTNPQIPVALKHQALFLDDTTWPLHVFGSFVLYYPYSMAQADGVLLFDSSLIVAIGKEVSRTFQLTIKCPDEEWQASYPAIIYCLELVTEPCIISRGRGNKSYKSLKGSVPEHP